MIKHFLNYFLIFFSGKFDRAYYLEKYPEVREMRINPLVHFIKKGWREGKNPSEVFNTKLYLELHPDVENVGINPLVHYIRFGKKESRAVENGISEEIQTEYIDLKSKADFKGAFPNEEDKNRDKVDIILFPIIDWHYRYQRPQQLAGQLAQRGHRIFYIRTGFFEADWPQIRKIKQNIFSVKLARDAQMITFNTTLTDADVLVLEKSILALKAACSIEKAVMLVDLPFWRNLVLQLKKTLGWPCVYDCMDLHTGFSISTEATAKDECLLLENCDLVLATSYFLLDHVKIVNPNAILVPNGAAYEFFHQAAQPMPIEEVQDLPHPIIGYYGAIADWFDSALVHDLALLHSEWTFLLIGSTLLSDLKPLKGIENIHLLGEKPYNEIPGYLSHFDVGIIPFKQMPLTHATNPVKMYEYLSAGKPIVATRLDEISHYEDYVHLAESRDEWEAAIMECLAEEKTLALLQGRFEFAKANTWEKRAEVIEKQIIDLI
jgi:glycosyltransferase involved in cell wall biosynthesis